MTLNNIKTLKDQKGFTIVELLIVIVVIAILAAIVIVAYNGVQNRAKTSSGQSLANTIIKKAEAYNTINSTYPTTLLKFTNNESPSSTTAGSGGAEAKLDDTTSVTSTTMSASVSANGKVVEYQPCAAGANIVYWDFTKPTASAATTVKAGAGC